MSLTTVENYLENAFKQNKATFSQQYSWHNVQQEAFLLLKDHISSSANAERYKYTPIAKLLPQDFNWNCTPVKHYTPPLLKPQDLSRLLPIAVDHYAIVLTNGKVNELTYQIDNQLPFPFKLIHFSEATGTYQTLLDNYFIQYSDSLTDPFAIINTSLFSEGVLLHIPDNTVLTKPICIYNYTCDTTHTNITYPRMLIAVGKNSCVSIINNWNTVSQEATYTNAVIDIQVDAYAQLTHYTLQLQGHEAYQIINTNCYQKTHSQVNNYTLISDHKVLRNNLSFHLEGLYAKNNMYGIYYLRNAQHVDNHTIVNHKHPSTESNELYKGILTDSSTGVFNGSIFVQPEAQKTNAFQTNHNILLSENATMHTKPQLQILADDVKCSHGATFGSFDENQLFYLQARGIPQKVAKQMLLQSFIDEIIHKVPLLSLQAFLQERLRPSVNDMGLS